MMMEPRLLRVDRPEMLALVREVMATHGEIWLRIPGRSMQPAIPEGAVVRLVPLRREARRGDVVLTVAPDGAPKLHRVVSNRGGHVVTQGDALKQADAPIHASAILALADRMKVHAVECGVPSLWQGRVLRILRGVRRRLYAGGDATE